MIENKRREELTSDINGIKLSYKETLSNKIKDGGLYNYAKWSCRKGK